LSRNKTALLALVFAGLNFGSALCFIIGLGFGGFSGLEFGRGFCMAQAIWVGIMFVKRGCITRIVRARNPGHAHGRRRIHSIQPFYGGVWADIRQKLIGKRATIWAFYLMHPDSFVIVVHPEPPFLTEHLLVQWLIIKFVPAHQSHMKCIQRIIRY
jgi:hypothetical protein